MNILELDKFIAVLKTQNFAGYTPWENQDLIDFYEGKRKELLKEINKKITNNLKNQK